MTAVAEKIAIPHFVRGELIEGSEVEHRNFSTPALELDRLVWPRTEPVPAAEVPLDEIIEVLAAAGRWLNDDSDGSLRAAIDLLMHTSPYERRIIENSYAVLGSAFDPDRLRSLARGELGELDVLDGWRSTSERAYVRAFPARVIHVLAGNAPGVAAVSIARGALSKGVSLLKLPSNDLLTATAILRALAAVAPGHPVTRSFSAVYWRGGDEVVEGTLFRPQYFDKLCAWGGESAIGNAVKYLGPGFELISFDPKNSISMIGREVFESEATMREAAAAAATDATPYNQEACVSARFIYMEGDVRQIDEFCELLQVELGAERFLCSAVVDAPPQDLRDEIDVLAGLEPMYRVFGQANGHGLVVRSDEPVEFFPSNKTVNVVAVGSLEDALRYINVSTQTVSVFPAARRRELRDPLGWAGAQRIVPLGGASTTGSAGQPHDGFFPLHRMMRWVSDHD